jgi:hypothetical protein
VAGNGGEMVGWIKNEPLLTPLDEAVAYRKEIDRELYELAQIMDQ